MKKNIKTDKINETISRFAPKNRLNKGDLEVFNESIVKILERNRQKIIDNNNSFLHGIFLPDSEKILIRNRSRLIETNIPHFSPTLNTLDSDSPPKPPIKYIDAVGIWPNDTPSGYAFKTSQWPPYTFGSPMQENFSPQNIQWSNGARYSSFSELSDPENGFISLGCLGGHNYYDGLFSGPNYPMTQWFLGDMVSAHGSFTQTVRVEGWVQKQSNIKVHAYLWNAIYDFVNGFYCFPGPSDAYEEGLIALVGIVTVTLQVGADISLKSGTLHAPVSHSKKFMEIIINQNEWIETTYAFDHGNLFMVDATIPVDTNVDSLSINVAVDVFGLRGGVNDPKGGMVGCAFKDVTKNTKPQIGEAWWIHPQPFEIPFIKIFTSL